MIGRPWAWGPEMWRFLESEAEKLEQAIKEQIDREFFVTEDDEDDE